jgi:DNA-binding CsgD family transcriptional regulator
MLILDQALRILSSDRQAKQILNGLTADGCLPTEIHQKLNDWISAGMPASETTFVTTQGLLARALVLAGESPAIGLLLEATRSRESLEDASQRYRLSGREREVSRHIIDGNSSGEISLELGISEYTVADYLKRIFAKTGARSRSELVAMLLGWRPSAQPMSLRRISQ